MEFIKKFKVVIIVVAVLILAIGGYLWYQKANAKGSETRSILTTVAKGSIISSVSGSGQVAVTNQIDIKAKASGDIVTLSMTKGQEVQAGDLLLQLNTKQALKTIRDAKINLQSAQLSMEKMQQPADQLSILQAQNAITQAEESKRTTLEDMNKNYEDAVNTISDSFLQMPNIMIALEEIVNGTTFTVGQNNMDYLVNSLRSKSNQFVINEDSTLLLMQSQVEDGYKEARLSYDTNYLNYKAVNRNSETTLIDALLTETYETDKEIADTIKSVNNFLQYYKDRMSILNHEPLAKVDEYVTDLNSYTSQVNNHLSNLLAIKQTIQNNLDNIVSAERTIAEKQASLDDLNAGSDPLDIQAQEITITQRQNALADAQEELANYSVRAPFAGLLASVDAQEYDSISSGATVGSLITNQTIAEIALNEVDAAKVQVGQKATLTFDAITDLTISGEVVETDILGTVSQGVVTYTIKVGFDTQDTRVKPGMSVTATIITDVKQDVLILPSAAIKSSGDASYVEMPDETVTSDAATTTGVVLKVVPKQQTVEVGLTDDTNTEITSGLSEGDKVILRTTTATTTKSTNTNSSKSILGEIGGGGAGGNMPRPD